MSRMRDCQRKKSRDTFVDNYKLQAIKFFRAVCSSIKQNNKITIFCEVKLCINEAVMFRMFPKWKQFIGKGG